MYNKNRKCVNDVNGFQLKRHRVRQGSSYGLPGRQSAKSLWWSVKDWYLERAVYD